MGNGGTSGRDPIALPKHTLTESLPTGTFLEELASPIISPPPDYHLRKSPTVASTLGCEFPRFL